MKRHHLQENTRETPNIFSGWHRKWNPWSSHFRQPTIGYLCIPAFIGPSCLLHHPQPPNTGDLELQFPPHPRSGSCLGGLCSAWGGSVCARSSGRVTSTLTRAPRLLPRAGLWTSMSSKGHLILCPSTAFSFNTLDLCSDYFGICLVAPQFSAFVKTRDTFSLRISSAVLELMKLLCPCLILWRDRIKY